MECYLNFELSFRNFHFVTVGNTARDFLPNKMVLFLPRLFVDSVVLAHPA